MQYSQGLKVEKWRKSLISLGNLMVLPSGFFSPLQGLGGDKNLSATRIERALLLRLCFRVGKAVRHGA